MSWPLTRSASKPSPQTLAGAVPGAKPIALVGMMGVGKSSVGAILARRLGWPFIDTDAEIERLAGLSVSQIFESSGEPYFRSLEQSVIEHAFGGSVSVIALGGGSFVDPDLRRFILQKGTTVWLDASVDVLARRTGTGASRPLLKDQDPRTVLAALSERRRAHYSEAPVHIRTDADTADDTVDAIFAALRLQVQSSCG